MKTYIQVLLSLVIAYTVSSYLSAKIFTTNSPAVDSMYIANITSDFSQTGDKLMALFKRFDSKSTIPEHIANIPAEAFKPITKGVSAAELEGEKGEVVLSIQQGTEYKVRQITLSDGAVVNIIDFTGGTQ